MLKLHEHSAKRLVKVRAAYEEPSPYDEALRLLARRSLPRRPAMCCAIGRSPTRPAKRWSGPHWAPIASPKSIGICSPLGKELTDLEDTLRRVTTV